MSEKEIKNSATLGPASTPDEEFLIWGNGEKPGGISGVGPWVEEYPDLPVPDGDQYDPELLANGDRRNVVDKYRYWTVDAIRADLATSRQVLHIAIENLEHDLNIGSIVRTGNAFNVGGVHIVGRKRWNRRGALVTDRYLDVYHHPTVDSLAEWAREHDYELVAVDNMEGSTPIADTELPQRAMLVFGQESVGLSEELLAAADSAVYIPQFGSTRSMNVAAAAAVAMHMWVLRHGPKLDQ
ncbi:MAG: RNA methyltransferase [Actinomycetaceae bacterium]|nr:RNA methyltransferase [Actinomycetaceae bacterium]